ncbi:MAG: hypothetical protein J1E57_07925 [Prevotella sp.]|nr:hypothetical protein [Prevotella sp.]
MKTTEIFANTFKAMRSQLHCGNDRDNRPMWQRRLSCNSDFCKALVLCGYMTEQQMQHVAADYRLGIARNGGVIFWQIDERDILRDGKIMHYRSDCHRDHQRKPSWVSYRLRSAGMLPRDFRPEHCLFGLHLIADGNKADATVCVVESEKTAVIMSALKPSCLWLATGGKTELNVAKLRPLRGRRVMLFPDTDESGDTYRQWYDVAEAAADVLGQSITVSTLLEQHATPEQKAAKIDIADLFNNKKHQSK